MRYERKYLLDRDTAYLLKQRLSYILTPDSAGDGGQYKVSSVYFDDRYNSAFYDKMNGVSQREKLRVRYYNDSMELIHLECKHKHGQMIWKEHEELTKEQFEMMREGDYSFMKTSPEQRGPLLERFYAAHLLKQLRPVITIDYDRLAYTHRAGDVRITFDSGLKAGKPSARSLFSVLSDKNVILEVKYTHFLPLLISDMLSGFQFTQQLAVSKFVMGRLALQGK